MNGIIGKADVKNALIRSLGKLSHCYIFYGAEGVGKFTLAMWFASMLFCEGVNKPCGECGGCVKVGTGGHPDLYVLDRAPDKLSLGVAQVRDTVADMYVRPLISERKVYIVKNADLLTAEAQNAFLKALEEPPGFTVIILLAKNLNPLLKTVLSRAATLYVPPLSRTEMLGYLAEYHGGAGRTHDFIARYSAGVIGTAAGLIGNGEFNAERDVLIDKMCGLFGSSVTSVFCVLDLFNKDNYELHLTHMLSFFRDILVVKSACGDSLVWNSDKTDIIKKLAGQTVKQSLYNCVRHVVNIEVNKSSNVNLIICAMLMRCWEELNGLYSRS